MGHLLKCLFGIHFIDTPDAPKNLEITEVTNSDITIEWQAPRNDGGAPVLSYVVERRQGFSSRFLRIDRGTVLDTYYRDTHVYEDCDYEYRVSAENEAGVGAASKPVGPVTVKDPYGELTNGLKFD